MNLFNRLSDGQPHLLLILTLAAAQQVLKKYHARYHALNAVAVPRHCH